MTTRIIRNTAPRTARGGFLSLVAGLGMLASAGIAQAAGSHTVSHDGFTSLGDHLVYVGVPRASEGGKTRAQVEAELKTARANPVLQDGWRQDGDGLRYVGQHVPAGVGKSRMAVLDELRAWRAHPVHPDGWSSVGDSAFFHGVADQFKLSAMPAETVLR